MKQVLKTWFKSSLVIRLILGVILLGTGPVALASGNAASQPIVSIAESGKSVRTVSAKITIDAPVSAVWQTVTNYNAMTSYMPGYQQSRVAQNNGSSKLVQFGLKVSSLLPVFNYQARVLENKAAHNVQIQRVSGDFKDFSATYRLTPGENNQTILVYTLTIDLDGIPAIGATQVLKSNTVKSMVAVRQQAVKNHKRSLVANAG
ncbi:MAG: SRPBCC family protein [Candidatus Melainabacteria bacterium]